MGPLGPAPRADETFGPTSIPALVRLRSALLQAPARLTAVARTCIAQDQPDCLWVTCCGLHVAGHQFFHLASIRDSRQRAALEGTRLELARGYDRMIGSLVEMLPRGSRVFVTYAKGMGRVTEWSDLLPAMLQRILGEKEADQPVNSLRRLIPVSIRRWAALPLTDRRVLQVMARMSTPGRTGVAHAPSACPRIAPALSGCNLAGRERRAARPERDRAGADGRNLCRAPDFYRFRRRSLCRKRARADRSSWRRHLHPPVSGPDRHLEAGLGEFGLRSAIPAFRRDSTAGRKRRAVWQPLPGSVRDFGGRQSPCIVGRLPHGDRGHSRNSVAWCRGASRRHAGPFVLGVTVEEICRWPHDLLIIPQVDLAK